MEDQKAEVTEDSLRAEQVKLKQERAQRCAKEIDAVLAKHRCTIVGEALPRFEGDGSFRVSTRIHVAAKD